MGLRIAQGFPWLAATTWSSYDLLHRERVPRLLKQLGSQSAEHDLEIAHAARARQILHDAGVQVEMGAEVVLTAAAAQEYTPEPVLDNLNVNINGSSSDIADNDSNMTTTEQAAPP